MPSLPRRLLAEALGTFALVFFGCAAVAATGLPNANFGLLGIALAHAIALGVMVTAAMNISGAHFNPAVTTGLMVTRRIDPTSGVAYIATQLAAAVFAAFCLKMLFPLGAAKTVYYGAPAISSQITLMQAIGLEAVMTFFLMSAIYGTAVNPDAPKVGGFGIGLTLVFAILVGGPLTGAALNPARAFGPALIAGQWVGHIAYWIGPILGAVVAALLWEKVLIKK